MLRACYKADETHIRRARRMVKKLLVGQEIVIEIRGVELTNLRR